AEVLYERLRLKGGTHKTVTLAALARTRGPRALAICDEILGGKIEVNEQQAMLMVRILRGRDDALELLKRLQQHKDPLVRAAAKVEMPAPGASAHHCQASLSDLSKLQGELRGFDGDSILLAHPAVLEGDTNTPIDLPLLRLPLRKADSLVLMGNKPEAPREGSFCRLFLMQGSLVTGTLVRVTADMVEVDSKTFGKVSVSRSEVQGLTTDPKLDRLLGASDKHDKVQLRSRKSVTGQIQKVDTNAVTLRDASGKDTKLPLTEVAGMLFKRPLQQPANPRTYTRLNLTNGDRILCHIADINSSHVGIVTRDLGSTVVPLSKMTEMEFEVGGGAMWGFTLLADYSDNRIAEYDDQGRKVFEIEEIFGVWDVECLENGNLLITEFSVNRVREITRKGEDVWVFDDLKNPYDADRLPNGNTLIADTFGRRVIEVDKDGKVAWTFDKSVQPYDVDRLANGNTLIADGHEDRVIEVNKQGEIVWQLTNMANVHDADRLPNGNTLLTIRMLNLVREVDPTGKTVMEIKDLSAPSDADRLPNGHTLVAENGMVREFDRHGNQVWKLDTTWAVEVNRY
ncbi:MAG: NHL repeat-containing protein, partial [Planctomycetota bacterium]